ncbi:MAG: beta-ketoacyl-ACP synthase [Cyanobacteria bacterium P01_D01_bin.36]
MTDVVVTGIGLTTALGPTADVNWQRLMAGESAIALRQPFSGLPPGPLAMAGKHPLDLNSLTRQLVDAAYQDAEIADAEQLWGETCGVVMGSSRSHLQQWERMAIAFKKDGPQSDSLRNWLPALPHQPAILAAQQIGARGPVLAPMAACATGVWAIAQAADLIRNGQCDRVLAGAVEAPITPLTLAGFRKMGALAKTGCYPFDVNREGFVLGEGGALMILEAASVAKERGAKIYGRVLATGITNDSHHVSSFDPSYEMGQRAVELCLQRSGLSPELIDAVHVHGTSTAQNDRMEASLIERWLPADVPIMATKGATGHTLGASGALIVALSLLSLSNQALVPCVGLKEAAFDLNFVRAGKQAQIEQMLCFSFGFGGQNAVLAIAR